MEFDAVAEVDEDVVDAVGEEEDEYFECRSDVGDFGRLVRRFIFLKSPLDDDNENAFAVVLTVVVEDVVAPNERFFKAELTVEAVLELVVELTLIPLLVVVVSLLLLIPLPYFPRW